MFKTNEVSLFEQHVEKGVLALCAIFFLYALFHWGFSSPRRLDGLPPDEVDASLAAKAKTIMSRMAEDRNTDPPSPVDSSAEFKKLQEADNFDKIPPLIAIGPSRAPIKTDRVKGPGRKRVVLQDVASVIPPPGKPEIWSGQELPRTERPADTLAAHVAAVYPWGQLHARWNKALDKTLIITPKMLAVNVEIESRLMWPDGSWGAWKSLEATAYGPTTTEGYRSKPPTIPEPDEQNQQQVADAVQKLQEWQQHILEPEYPDIWWPGHGWVTWRLHLPPNEVGFVPKLDSEELPAGVTPRDRFRPTPIRRSPVSPGRMPGGPGGPGGRMGPGGPGGRMGPGGPGGRMEPGGPGGRMEPGGPVGPGRRPLPDRPDRPISPGTVIPDETAPLPVEQIVPALDQQMVDGQVLAWVHTTSLESGKTYQFRVRLVLLNPLLMEHYSVKKGHEADAGIVTVATPWSDPSDLVYVPKATEFFVTGFSPNTRTVSVSVFRQCLGQTVMRNFTVGLGQSIGKKQQVAVIDPVNNVKVTRAVDFSTGAVAVAFDFDKRVPKGPVHVPTVEALYLDEKGQLRSRVGSVDEGSERYTKLRTDALQAKAAVRQATTGIE